MKKQNLKKLGFRASFFVGQPDLFLLRGVKTRGTPFHFWRENFLNSQNTSCILKNNVL